MLFYVLLKYPNNLWTWRVWFWKCIWSDQILPKVTHPKLLGVIIDNRLSWDHHIKALTKKLSCCTGNLNQIIESIPENLHTDLHHTLFESYLNYGISVWSGSPKAKLLLLFKAQKKVTRVIFGDRAKYLDKFKTCARVRPLNEQRLTTEFFIKGHSKPLFNSYDFKNDFIYFVLYYIVLLLKIRNKKICFSKILFLYI